MTARMIRKAKRRTPYVQGLPSFGLARLRVAIRFPPSMRKAMANPRNKESRVRLQNFRKNTPAITEAVAITPMRNASILISVSLPDQAVKQQDHGDGGGREPGRI